MLWGSKNWRAVRAIASTGLRYPPGSAFGIVEVLVRKMEDISVR